MKKIILNLGLLIALGVFSLPTIFAFGANEYTVLAPLPGIGDDSCNEFDITDCQQKTTLEKYLPGMFNLAIGISAAFAVLMIVIGGFQYMSTDALQKKEDGKKRIENSIYGLLLVIGAWLILYTINPALLTLRLGIEPITLPTPAGGTLGGTGSGGPILTQEQKDESEATRIALRAQGVVAYTGYCNNGAIKDCVNMNGLQDVTKSGLVALKNSFGSNIIITGGTEGGHSETGGHPTGNSVDLGFSYNPNLATFVETNKVGAVVNTSLGPRYTLVINGKNVSFLKESDHWHVTFN